MPGRWSAVMNLLRSGTLLPIVVPKRRSGSQPISITCTRSSPVHSTRGPPRSLGSPPWASATCASPRPFEPGASGDIFVHATFDRLHPALGFGGSAEQGLSLAVEQAAREGLRLMLDIAPGQVAIDAPLRQRQPDWFRSAGDGPIADPRRPPRRIDVALPRFGQTALGGCGIRLVDRPSDAAHPGWRRRIPLPDPGPRSHRLLAPAHPRFPRPPVPRLDPRRYRLARIRRESAST